MPPAPSRFARWLLEAALPRGVRGDSIRGDLLEEFRARATVSPRAARRWYWRQALGVSTRSANRRLSHDPDSPTLPARRATLMDSLTTDFTASFRALAKARGFTLACVATLALGIGAATAVFSVVEAVLMRPLPITDPSRVVWMSETFFNTGGNMSIAWPDYLDWRARLHSYEDSAAIVSATFNLVGAGAPERLTGRRVSSRFLQVLGVRPALGRDFADTDDRVGAAPVVIISDAFWRDHLGSSEAVVGRTITLDDIPRTIIGVLPATFRYNPLQNDTVFLPLGATATAESGLMDRGNHDGLTAVARLRPGVTVASARQELNDLETALRHQYPGTNANVGATITPLAERLTNGVGAIITTLFAAVAVLLLLAAVNVASLAIARGVSRRQELAVRSALGCSRGRLIRYLLAENLLLAVTGGLGGLAVAAGLIRALVSAAPPSIPRLDEVRIDALVWLFAMGASVLIALLVALLPGLQASSTRDQQSLVRTSRGDVSSATGHRSRRALMVVELALAVILLTGAGLMARSMHALTTVDPGFDPSHLLTLRVSVSGDESAPGFNTRLSAFLDRLLTEVRAVPGVVSASVSLSLPIEGSQWGSVFIIDGAPTPTLADTPSAAWEPVSTSYFETMRMRLKAGRTFGPEDTASSQKVIIVNEQFVQQFLHGEPAVGRRIRQGWPSTTSPAREIVGVVGDIKLDGLDQATEPEIYMPLAQHPTTYSALAVRTAGDPAALLPSVRAVIGRLDPRLPLFSIHTMDDLVDTNVARQRLTMLIFGGFAGLALVLACVGLYGVVAHGVSARTREIGVRLALGATGRQVMSLFVSQGMVTTSAGLLVGSLVALALAKVVEAQGLLFQVDGRDPASFVAAAGTLFLVSATACYLPARRASRVDPTVALRGE